MPGGRPPVDVAALAAAARAVRAHAYAPYSRFRVGAALLGADGRIYTGCNVENGSYGLTVCAERNAVAAAVAAGCRRFEAIAVVGNTEEPVRPCGACRQVLAEFGALEVIMLGRVAGEERREVLELLPLAFTPAHLAGEGATAEIEEEEQP